MTRKFDPSVLFERYKPDPAFKSDKAELDAVQAGTKAMMAISFPLPYIAAGGEEFVGLVRGALDRGLAVTICNEALPTSRSQPFPCVYVLPLDQTWRISALNAMHETMLVDGPWTLAADAQHSLLLGYTPEQREVWLADVRHRQAAYGCKTVYTLLTEEQRASAVALGKRCLGAASELEGMNLFFHRTHELLKPDAGKLVPKDLTLARVGLDWKVVEPLFGSWEKLKPQRLVTGTITGKLGRQVTEALRTNVEFLTAGGWS